MNFRRGFVGSMLVSVLMFSLLTSRPAAAQDSASLLNLRQQYDAMMANFDTALKAQGDSAGVSKVQAGRDAMRALTDQARLSGLVRHHQGDLEALLARLGPQDTEAVLTEFLAASPASSWPAEQSRAFESWLAERPDLRAIIASASAS